MYEDFVSSFGVDSDEDEPARPAKGSGGSFRHGSTVLPGSSAPEGEWALSGGCGSARGCNGACRRGAGHGLLYVMVIVERQGWLCRAACDMRIEDSRQGSRHVLGGMQGACACRGKRGAPAGTAAQVAGGGWLRV